MSLSTRISPANDPKGLTKLPALVKENNLEEIKLNEHLNFKQLTYSELSELDWAAADIPFVERLIFESNG